MASNLLSCNLASYGKFAEASYDHLPSIGITHVEIHAPSAADIDAVQARLSSHGLSASSVIQKTQIGNADAVAEFVSGLEAAEALGAKVVFTSVKAGDVNRQIVYDRLRAIGDEAGKRGITVGMETHPDLITNAEVALETMAGIDHPNVRVNYDTANIHYYNHDVDSVEELRKVISCVGSMHLKDTNGGYETWFFPTFGEGIVDFKAVFELLSVNGFHGPYAMEIEGCSGEELNEVETCQRVADSVAHLRRIGCDV